MGLFLNKCICTVCGEPCDFPKYKLKNGDWLCQDCLSDAGLSGNEAKQMLPSDIKNKMQENDKKQNIAISMYRYAVTNGYGNGFNETWGIKHFRVIADNLDENEKVLMTFIGLKNYESATKHDNYFAFAITNKRFIMAQKNIISGETIQTVYLDNINDITFKSGIMFGVLTIDTIKEVFSVGLDKSCAKAIHDKAITIIRDIKKEKDKPEVQVQTAQISIADEILKFKQLMDAGIITAYEFEKKKKELLNL